MSGAVSGSPPESSSTAIPGSNSLRRGSGKGRRRGTEEEGRRKRPEVEHYKPPGAKKTDNSNQKKGDKKPQEEAGGGGGGVGGGKPLKTPSKKRSNARKEKGPRGGGGGKTEQLSNGSAKVEEAPEAKKQTARPKGLPHNGHSEASTNEARKSNQRSIRKEHGDSNRRHWNGGPRPVARGEKPRRGREAEEEDSSRKGSLSSPSESLSKPSFKLEDALCERITDWSLEVEMEDERKQREKEEMEAQRVSRAKRVSPPSNNHKNAGGIIHIPPSGVESSSWREDPYHSHQQHSHRRHRATYDQPKHHHTQTKGSRRDVHSSEYHPPPPNQQHHIYSSQSSASYNGSGGVLPPSGVDPPRVNYQHPIPYGLSLRPNGPEWYDVFNSRIYGNDKHDINNISLIVRCDLRIYEITMQGSWEVLAQLWDSEVADCRANILKAFEELLKSDLVFCLRHNVELHIWKIAFWNLTEVLKILLQKEDSPELRAVIKSRISELIEEGIAFYERALRLLESTYGMDLESYYDVLKPRPSDKFQRCVLGSAQNCLICLGDLARYRELVNEGANFGVTRGYYLKAASVETRNAKPFHMLAILSSMTKRKLEAIYYHMRCLTCKNAFRTEQQSLTVLFEEFKKSWEAGERERVERRKGAVTRSASGDLIKGTRLRNEIWIRSEGGRRLHRTTSAREAEAIAEEDLRLMESNSHDLAKRFVTTFIYLLGKLFTYIDMDSFPPALEVLQKEFRVLLSRSPLPLDARSLVQIMAMNMFIVEHTKMKNGDTANYRSSMQNAALQLAFEMFGILVERCNALYAQLSGEAPLYNEELGILLPPVKVWCDWMLGNNDTWYPVVSEEPFNQLATLATHLEKLKPLLTPVLVSFVTEEEANRKEAAAYALVKLEEDAVLCGLNPWFRGLDWASYRRYCPLDLPQKTAVAVRRLDAINFCVEFLEGLESPILKWSLPDNAHISLVESNEPSSAVEKVNAKLSNMLACQEDILEESYSDEEQEQATESAPSELMTGEHHLIPNEEIRALKHRKETLERQRLVREREMSRMQRKILSDHVSVTLEVRPHYIVADTNCFVDHLEGIQALVSSQQQPYHLRVPLVVLNELDGLSKGARPSKYSSLQHAHMVSENARRALTFLRSRPPNSKCVTARGTLLNSFNVTTEEDASGKKNDDLILGVCLNLSLNKEEHRGNMRIVYRDVVLLTDDRNLKLKAHITDIPVNKFIDFFNWAKLA